MVRGQMTRKEYDFAFSLGFSCACSESLRAEGLQFESCPFDWVGVTDVLQTARIVAGGFEGWLERDDLDLWDVRILGGFATRVYRNRKTGIGFVHEFSNDAGLDAAYPAVKAKFDRRIPRFLDRLRRSRRVLAVYLEVSKNPRAADATLVEARRLLSEAFPETSFDLLYLYEDPEAKTWAAEPPVADGVTVVRLDYRTYLNGEIMHLCRNGQIRDCLRTLAHVPDVRTPEQKAAFAAFKRDEMRSSLGKGWLERKVNKKLRQLFRDLESYLEGQHILPGDRPLWFDGDGK